MSQQCVTCNNIIEGITCKAFPEGIPQAILDGGVDHTQPYPGDNGFRYEVLMLTPVVSI
jgi:hypothetical protein